jgi:hypothetical protein
MTAPDAEREMSERKRQRGRPGEMVRENKEKSKKKTEGNRSDCDRIRIGDISQRRNKDAEIRIVNADDERIINHFH